MLSSGYDVAFALVDSQQLWLLTQDQADQNTAWIPFPRRGAIGSW